MVPMLMASGGSVNRKRIVENSLHLTRQQHSETRTFSFRTISRVRQMILSSLLIISFTAHVDCAHGDAQRMSVQRSVPTCARGDSAHGDAHQMSVQRSVPTYARGDCACSNAITKEL